MTEHMKCKKCGSPIRRGFTETGHRGQYVMCCSRKTCDNYVKLEIISPYFKRGYENYEIPDEALDNETEIVCPACGLGEKGPEKMPRDPILHLCMECGLEFSVWDCDVAKYSSRRKEDCEGER